MLSYVLWISSAINSFVKRAHVHYGFVICADLVYGQFGPWAIRTIYLWSIRTFVYGLFGPAWLNRTFIYIYFRVLKSYNLITDNWDKWINMFNYDFRRHFKLFRKIKTTLRHLKILKSKDILKKTFWKATKNFYNTARNTASHKTGHYVVGWLYENNASNDL